MTDAADRASGRTHGERVLFFEQHNIAHSLLCEVVRDACADGAAAHDDDLGHELSFRVVRQGYKRMTVPQNSQVILSMPRSTVWVMAPPQLAHLVGADFTRS